MVCLLRFPRAGWVLLIFTPPDLLQFVASRMIPQGLLHLVRLVYCVFHYYCLLCPAALPDLRGYAATQREGVGAWDDILNKNTMRVVVTLQENPVPLESSIFAKFCINC